MMALDLRAYTHIGPHRRNAPKSWHQGLDPPEKHMNNSVVKFGVFVWVWDMSGGSKVVNGAEYTYPEPD